MAVATQKAGVYNILTENYICDEAITTPYVAMSPVSAATGNMHVELPSGQGVIMCGILQKAVASGALAEVMEEGVSKVVAGEAFNCGLELTTLDGTGVLEGANSGDYVIAIAQQAATAAGEIVIAKIVSPYQKN